MHSFYYAICCDPIMTKEQSVRVQSIKCAAIRHGLNVYEETLPGITTLQVETDDAEVAAVFKLAAESALHEQHK